MLSQRQADLERHNKLRRLANPFIARRQRLFQTNETKGKRNIHRLVCAYPRRAWLNSAQLNSLRGWFGAEPAGKQMVAVAITRLGSFQRQLDTK